jgi:hypothetical protein
MDSFSVTLAGLLSALTDVRFSQLILPSLSSGSEEMESDWRCRPDPCGRGMGGCTGAQPEEAGFPMMVQAGRHTPRFR